MSHSLTIILVMNSFQEMNIIKFSRFLFFHVYLYFYKVDNESNVSAKVATWLVFTLLCSIFIFNSYNIINQFTDKSFSSISLRGYVVIYCIVGPIMAVYTYFENFSDFNTFSDYHTKYYIYFIAVVLFTISLLYYSSYNSRGRISQERVKNERIVPLV